MKISLAQFQDYQQQGYNRIPVTTEVLCDLETPLTVFLKLANQPYSYLFESVLGGEKWGRFSFIGLSANTVISIKDKKITLTQQDKIIKELTSDDPLQWLEEFHNQFRTPTLEHFPRFCGGFVGYFSYDTIRYIEPKLYPCPLPDQLNTPDILLMLVDEFVVFDTLKNKVHLMVVADASVKEAWEKAQQRLTSLEQQLRATNINPDTHNVTLSNSLTTNMTQGEYEQAVARAKQYLIDGDGMQFVLSQRLQTPYNGDPFNFYRALRSINPSPYLFYLNLKDFFIAGSSPEILVRLEDAHVTLRPLAGTRRRGHTLKEDLELEDELLGDPKELAEHLMLIDLGRNDVGHISEAGTVKVTEKMVVERYSHVMHIVSNVVGKIKKGLSSFDVLRATFPAGTLTGTPKIRAMQIIDELEKVKRNIYGGAIGYISWNGNMDLAIALRTAIIKDKNLYLQAGAGIVVDSIAENEWQECMNKAKALIKAAQLAETGLQLNSHLVHP